MARTNPEASRSITVNYQKTREFITKKGRIGHLPYFKSLKHTLNQLAFRNNDVQRLVIQLFISPP